MKSGGYSLGRFSLSAVHAGLLFASLAWLAPCASQAQNPEAWVVQSEGNAYLKQAPNATWLRVSDMLEVVTGDSLRTDQGASVVLLYSNGQRVIIGPNRRYAVGVDAPYETPAWLAESIQHVFAQKPPEKPSTTRGTVDEPPVLLYPRAGKVLSTSPSLKWLSAVPDDAQYRVRLVHDTHPAACLLSGTDVWETVIRTDTSLLYPRNDSLVRGERYWVELERTTKRSYEDYGCFVVGSEEERRDLAQKWKVLQRRYPAEDTADITAELAYAMQLIQQSYYADAFALLRRLSTKAPRSRAVQRLQNTVFKDAGPLVLISE
jgi:hypothetical protein